RRAGSLLGRPTFLAPRFDIRARLRFEAGRLVRVLVGRHPSGLNRYTSGPSQEGIDSSLENGWPNPRAAGLPFPLDARGGRLLLTELRHHSGSRYPFASLLPTDGCRLAYRHENHRGGQPPASKTEDCQLHTRSVRGSGARLQKSDRSVRCAHPPCAPPLLRAGPRSKPCPPGTDNSPEDHETHPTHRGPTHLVGCNLTAFQTAFPLRQSQQQNVLCWRQAFPFSGGARTGLSRSPIHFRAHHRETFHDRESPARCDCTDPDHLDAP